MGDVAAISVTQIAGSNATDNGQHGLIKLTVADGATIVLTIPRKQIPLLVDAAAAAGSQSEKKAGIEPDVHPAFNVTWWELGVRPATGEMILSLTFGAGGTLSFLLADGMPKAILETLQAQMGQSNPLPPDTSRH